MGYADVTQSHILSISLAVPLVDVDATRERLLDLRLVVDLALLTLAGVERFGAQLVVAGAAQVLEGYAGMGQNPCPRHPDAVETHYRSAGALFDG